MGNMNPNASISKLIRPRRLKLHVTCFCVALVIISGCAHRNGPSFRAGVGDVGHFIVEQAVLRGAEPITTHALPAVPGSWRYAADNSGVIVRLSRTEYPALEALLQQAFGRPHFGPVDTATGGRIGAYRISRKGAAIHFGRGADYTEVIVLRERTDADVAADFLRGLR